MNKQKRVVAIHDISCIGRCSLTVALPILSAAGFDTAVLPTAILSTHTGGFTNFTYRDLTEDIPNVQTHWETLNLRFDSIYTGFLGSFEQIDLVIQFIDRFKDEHNFVVVDPVMADNGVLYSVYSKDMVKGMVGLCKKADLIVPNLTEATFMLDEPYVASGYDKSYIEGLLYKLSMLGPTKVVLTGVSFDDHAIGAASYDRQTGIVSYAFGPKFDGHFHGTGDVFGSALVSGLLHGDTLIDATKLAVDFTNLSIAKTVALDLERKYGVCFEKAIPFLVNKINKG